MDAAVPEGQPTLRYSGEKQRRRGRFPGVPITIAVVGAAAGLAVLLAARAYDYRRTQAAIDSAAAALARADQADARTLAPSAWRRANETLRAAMTEYFAKRSRLVPLRSLRRTRELLAAAIDAADRARGAALAARQAAEQQTHLSSPPNGGQELRAGLLAALRGASEMKQRATTLYEALLRCRRPKPREFDKDMGMVKDHLDGYARQLAEIERTRGILPADEAVAEADAIRDRLQPLVQDLEGAWVKLRCR